MIEVLSTFILILPILAGGYVFLGMTGLLFPINIVLVPLGYRFSSCPNCPEFGIEKMDKFVCSLCDEEKYVYWRKYSNDLEDVTVCYTCYEDKLEIGSEVEDIKRIQDNGGDKE
jgi:hypothetical protein